MPKNDDAVMAVAEMFAATATEDTERFWLRVVGALYAIVLYNVPIAPILDAINAEFADALKRINDNGKKNRHRQTTGAGRRKGPGCRRQGRGR